MAVGDGWGVIRCGGITAPRGTRPNPVRRELKNHLEEIIIEGECKGYKEIIQEQHME